MTFVNWEDLRRKGGHFFIKKLSQVNLKSFRAVNPTNSIDIIIILFKF